MSKQHRKDVEIERMRQRIGNPALTIKYRHDLAAYEACVNGQTMDWFEHPEDSGATMEALEAHVRATAASRCT